MVLKVLSEVLVKLQPLVESNIIRPRKANPWVISPSIYTQNEEKVLCRLQIDELLDVYDIEVNTQKELGNYWRRGHCSPSCAFACAAPLKVGVEVTRLFYDKLRGDGWQHGSPYMNDLAVSRKRTVSENKSKCTKLVAAGDHPEGPRIKRPRHFSQAETNPQDTTPSEEESVRREGDREDLGEPSVKATKSDDAKVNKQQWDVWSVENFEPEGKVAAKVCIPGTYCQKLHGNLFSCLRKVAMRWYRKRIL